MKKTKEKLIEVVDENHEKKPSFVLHMAVILDIKYEDKINMILSRR